MSLAAAAQSAIAHLLTFTEAKKATVFLDTKTVISVCRRFKSNKRNIRNYFVLKIGAPNDQERQFIRACKKAGERLPVKRVQLRYWPVPRVAH